MSVVSRAEFCREYLKSLDRGDAALFAGAGLSRGSGFVDWGGLMKGVAEDLGLEIDKETDLIALAQYHVNERKGRAKINQLLVDEFTKDVKVTENHKLIAGLPIRTVWTTNYDRLVEDAYKQVHKRPDVKVSPENLTTSVPFRDVTIYKMHGDVFDSSRAVVTKEDYETYSEGRELFTIQLKGHLVSKTFLFVGFSFTDPNIDYILSRIRGLLGKDRRDHYCIMAEIRKRGRSAKMKAEYDYDRRKQELRIGDLERYGIHTVLVKDYSEITDILRELERRSHRRSIFVSGSAHDYAPLNEAAIDELSRKIGQRIIMEGCQLVSGFGLGIGSKVILGAMEEVYDTDAKLDERATLRPFPQEAPKGTTKEDLWHRYRVDMISKAGICVFLCGNKLDQATGKVVMGAGVLKEFGIAKTLGRYPIPIGATGHAAKQIWEEVHASLDRFFPMGGVKKHFEVIGDSSKTVDEILDAVFAIVKRATVQ